MKKLMSRTFLAMLIPVLFILGPTAVLAQFGLGDVIRGVREGTGATSRSALDVIPGLGDSTETVTITRRLPPTVDLEDTRISLEVASAGNVPRRYADAIESRLATQIQMDSRFVLDDRNPAAEVYVTATNLVLNPATASNVGGQRIHRVTGEMAVSFRVLDARDDHPLDTALLDGNVDRTIVELIVGGETVATEPVPTQAEVLELLIDDVTAQVTRRIAETSETVELKLPGGDLEQFHDEIRDGRWVSVYFDLEDMQDVQDAGTRAGVFYLMGLVKEAEAYEMTDPSQARDSLLTAVRHYQSAVEAHDEEADYQASARRAREAVVLLAGPTPEATPRGDSGSDDVWTNESVMDLVSGGMDSDLLIEFINDAELVDFDLGPSGLQTLARGDNPVPADVIRAMRERMARD